MRLVLQRMPQHDTREVLCYKRTMTHRLSLLVLSILEFLFDFVFRKPSGVYLQHRCTFFHGHAHLVTDRYQTFSQVSVILLDELYRDHEIFYIMEYMRMLLCIDSLSLQESYGVISPVFERIQMVECMIAVVITVAVALYISVMLALQ